MRFSLHSLAICLVSTQPRISLASPCKPVTTTTALAGTTTTTGVAEATTTTAIGDDSTTTAAGETTTTADSEATTTAALCDMSTTLSLSEGSITTALIERSSTTTLTQDKITTEEPTTTFEATTTTAAESTTTTEAFEGTQMPAVFADNTEKDTYIDRYGGTYSTPQSGGSTSKARFQIEPVTNRLFAYLVDGKKVYLFTVIPTGPNYAFQFDALANIDPYPDVYHYVQCTPDANNVLSCESESGPTPTVWYWSESNVRYYGKSDPDFDSAPIVHFRLQ
ncbi:uncharacterized protein FPRO_05555 [Fusarium proliferatum ET1]|uniref:Uncharacterized protein n=1 Tax=Fusarium proliferatum (strain ET1) TaxID=1227346 RepID=A0A1L7VF21_FUSPR|nr:uncharacterized protein FPRO_05555 [Fusarium proliferatum ET1]CZR39253.1 uncharacterized protein FPRO_05555 [Fusarium proliferatum ET1]